LPLNPRVVRRPGERGGAGLLVEQHRGTEAAKIALQRVPQIAKRRKGPCGATVLPGDFRRNVRHFARSREGGGVSWWVEGPLMTKIISFAIAICTATGELAFHEPQSSSRSRRTASQAGFFDLSQTFDGPLRYGESSLFETMPSRPNRQARSNTAGPSCARWVNLQSTA
jgi:hypothetical protein